jgi:SPP1 gp7 family putative phage head morphogenesis protein
MTNTKKKFKKPLRQPPPINQEKDYQKDLRSIVKIISEGVEKYLTPNINFLIDDFNKFKNKKITDDMSEDLDKMMSQIKVYLNNNVNSKSIAQNNAQKINSYNSKMFHEQIKHVMGVDMFLSEPWLADQMSLWVGTNVGLIKSLEDTALSQIQNEVQSGIAKGLRSEEISENISSRIGVAQSRANLIGRDQVSKFYGQLNKSRQQEIGINQYTWSTARDERVRTSHAEKEGNIYDWDNPPEDTGAPGEDINCRCVAMPIFDESLFN